MTWTARSRTVTVLRLPRLNEEKVLQDPFDKFSFMLLYKFQKADS